MRPRWTSISGSALAPTERQQRKLTSLRRTHPALLLLSQDDETAAIRFSIPARFARGEVQPARGGEIDASGRLRWLG